MISDYEDGPIIPQRSFESDYQSINRFARARADRRERFMNALAVVLICAVGSMIGWFAVKLVRPTIWDVVVSSSGFLVVLLIALRARARANSPGGRWRR